MLCGLQRDPVLRSGRACDRGLDRRQVELHGLGVDRLAIRIVPEPLFFGIGLYKRDLLLRTPREAQVLQGLVVDREDRTSRSVLRAHVAQRRPVRQRHVRHTRPEELHELAHHTGLAQHLRDSQNQVSGGGALWQFTGQLEPEHLRDQHAHRLAEHRSLGLNAADTPAQDTETVDHRRVRVGPHKSIGVGQQPLLALPGEDYAGKVLQIHLVTDPGVRRHHQEVIERLLCPAQQLVPLLVAFELQTCVAPESISEVFSPGRALKVK